MKAVDYIWDLEIPAVNRHLQTAQEIVKYPEDFGVDAKSLFLKWTAYGDYNNTGTVQRSNHESMLKVYPWLQVFTLAYGYNVLYIPGELEVAVEDVTNPEAERIESHMRSELDRLASDLEGLDGYPVFDEDHLSNLEHELTLEAIADWARTDIKDERLKALRDEDPEGFVERTTRALYNSGQEFCIFEDPFYGHILNDTALLIVETEFAGDTSDGWEEEEDDTDDEASLAAGAQDLALS